MPENNFAAFSEGRIVSLVFVSILMGLAMGLKNSPKAEEALHPVRIAYEAIELAFIWLIYLLDIGILPFVIIDLKVKSESEWVVG